MQLVNDCVVMYDTMKDKRIGIAEVIEKFGVPPEKVIEVQALIGDSTDNVPGVPGIGVKTAAQLIGEYGDLETLLARAGEIKQEKRRQTLIDNAEQARLSKRLVTLDEHVKLDVPLADLAVHEPDYKRLIAFLKAMEFSLADPPRGRVLRRRCGGDRGGWQARAAPRHLSEVPRRLPSATRSGRAGRRHSDEAEARRAPAHGRSNPAEQAEGRSADQRASSRRKCSPPPRLNAARNAKVDRSRYETVRTLDRLNAWIARARELGRVAIDTETTSLDPMQAELCGFSLALAPNEACYVPLAHRKGGEGGTAACSPATSRPTRFPSATRSTRSSRCWRTRACSRSARTSSSTGRSSRCAASRSRPTTTPC